MWKLSSPCLHSAKLIILPLLDGRKNKGAMDGSTALASYNLEPNFTLCSSHLSSWHFGDSPIILREDDFQKQTFFRVECTTVGGKYCLLAVFLPSSHMILMKHGLLGLSWSQGVWWQDGRVPPHIEIQWWGWGGHMSSMCVQVWILKKWSCKLFRESLHLGAEAAAKFQQSLETSLKTPFIYL